MSGNLGNAVFSLRVDVTNLVSGLNSARTFVEQATAQIDALLVGIGTGRAGAGTPFASLEAQIAQLNTQLASYTAEVTRAGEATVSLAQPAQVTAADLAGLGAAVEAETAAVDADTAAKVANVAATDAMSAANRTAAQGVVSGAGLSTRGGGLLAGLGAVTLAFQGLRTAGDFAKTSVIDFNAELQQDAIRLQNLVGGLDQANAVLADIAQKSTGAAFGGFDFADLEHGTEILARFGVANQTVEQQVADVAAGTGQSYSAVAQQVGRLYDLLDNGQPIGRVAVQLERSGILTADWVSKLEAAQKAGADQATLDTMLTEGLAKYNGQAEQLGNTWPAVTTEITNDLKLIAAETGKPIFDVLLAGLKDLRDDLLVIDELAKGGNAVNALNASLEQLGLYALEAAKGVAELADVGDRLLGVNQPEVQQIQSYIDTLKQQIAQQYQGIDLANVLSGAGGGGPGGADQFGAAGQQAGKSFAEAFTATSLDQLAQGFARFGDAGDAALRSIVAELEQANPMLGEMVADYERLATDQVAVQAATFAMADAQQHLADVTAQANAELKGLQDSIAADQAIAAQHTNAYQGTIDNLRAQIAGIQDQAKAADEAWTTTIDNLRTEEQGLQRAAQDRKQAWQDTITAAQEDLRRLQDAAGADQAAFQAQLDGLQRQQQALADAASQHAGAYKAILDGTIDTYVQLTGKEDDLTQAVRARWQEEVAGQLRAKTGADAAVRAKQEEQDRSTLALDTQIAQARQQGNQREIAALEARKKQIDAGYAAELQLLNDKKKVADDQFQDTSDQVNKAAQHQATQDQAAQNAVKAQIQGVQDAQKAQQQADQEAIKAQQDRIRNIQDRAAQQDRVDQAAIKGVQDQITNDQDLKTKQDARFKDEEDAIQKQIGLVQQQQQAQELMDKVKQGADQQHYNDRKAYWDQEETNARNAVTVAQQTEQIAKDQLTYDQQHLDNLKQQAQWQDYLNKLIAANPALLTPPFPATEGPRAPTIGAPAYTTPPAPGQQGYQSPFPTGTPQAAPQVVGPTSQGPHVTAADYRPASAGATVNQTNTFNVTGADAHAITDQLGAHVFDATQAALEQAGRGGYNLARVRA